MFIALFLFVLYSLKARSFYIRWGGFFCFVRLLFSYPSEGAKLRRLEPGLSKMENGTILDWSF